MLASHQITAAIRTLIINRIEGTWSKILWHWGIQNHEVTLACVSGLHFKPIVLQSLIDSHCLSASELMLKSRSETLVILLYIKLVFSQWSDFSFWAFVSYYMFRPFWRILRWPLLCWFICKKRFHSYVPSLRQLS